MRWRARRALLLLLWMSVCTILIHFDPFCTSVFWPRSAVESQIKNPNMEERTRQTIICEAMSNYRYWGRRKIVKHCNAFETFWFQRECCQNAVKDCLAGADWRGVRGDDHATGTASDWPKEYRVGTCWKPWIPWVENAAQKWFKQFHCLTPLSWKLWNCDYGLLCSYAF